MSDNLKHIPTKLSGLVTELRRETGEVVHRGKFKNLSVTVFPTKIYVRGSLGVFLLGTNLKTLTREQAASGIECLSDELEIDMSHARISRLDFGTNLILEHRLADYMAFFGDLPRHSKNAFGSLKNKTITFSNSRRHLRFYDKIREQKSNGYKIADTWCGLNVCRYEVSFSRPAQEFKVQSITANMLSEHRFFCKVLQTWNDMYFKIPKMAKMKIISDLGVKTTPDFSRFAVIHLAQNPELYSAWMSEFDRPDLSKTQRSRLKSMLRESRIDRRLTIPDNRITELDQKVIEAAKLYQS